MNTVESNSLVSNIKLETKGVDDTGSYEMYSFQTCVTRTPRFRVEYNGTPEELYEKYFKDDPVVTTCLEVMREARFKAGMQM